ncbi:MAG TPA: hypothetical protein VHW44_26195, partial [Pseudonocardiaceae bacterium]|nr:hypothetical protein [Pseudonocardiaceae bacterium]
MALPLTLTESGPKAEIGAGSNRTLGSTSPDRDPAGSCGDSPGTRNLLSWNLAEKANMTPTCSDLGASTGLAATG